MKSLSTRESEWTTETLRHNRADAWPDEPLRQVRPDEYVIVQYPSMRSGWQLELSQWWRVEKGDLFLLPEDALERLFNSQRKRMPHYFEFLVAEDVSPVDAPFWRCRQDDPDDWLPAPPRPQEQVWPSEFNQEGA